MAKPSLSELPGGDLIEQGLADLRAGVASVPALLVEIGAPKLERLGLAIAGLPAPDPADLAEHRLYALLAREGSDAAHGRYNALIRRLVSFAHAYSTCATSPTPPK